ncbi:hypothetical protein [Argonema antarcticum]|uniref:hypothetical protein n=1 Tax=Argonema antarcticum TaxID=2942763 RepID=UPI0020112BCB|nr:hypothetical protein [Argonema antarcticum]MCL1475917.1 hypothetical protein [Argonema antarcticum A004/B2]
MYNYLYTRGERGGGQCDRIGTIPIQEERKGSGNAIALAVAIAKGRREERKLG